MEFEIVRCAPGDMWFPWNYRRVTRGGRVRMRRFVAEPGLVVLNAVSASGQVLGSCSLRVGYRHAEYVLGDEEYQYGAAAAGPAYFWQDDKKCPWILIVKSFWVRPAMRRSGIARAFAWYARDIGLPAYLAFANKHVEAWFDREYRPSQCVSPFQKQIAIALRAQSSGFQHHDNPDFTIFLQAEASALLLWEAWPGSTERIVSLDEALFVAERAGDWDVDSGEVFEPGFSDSAFAEDRCFGYVLTPWCESWGHEVDPWRQLPDDASDDDFDTAREQLAAQLCFAAGSIEGWITDGAAMCAYASVRHFLRTLVWQDFNDLNAAAQELFVSDLTEDPRGLVRFSALVSPIDQR